MTKTALTIGLAFALTVLPARADDPQADPPATLPTSKPATHPTSKPTTRIAATKPSHGKTPEMKAAEDAIKAATLALTKEAQDAFRKGTALPRSAPTYFQEKPASIDQDSLLTALGKSLSRDPRIDAYVKMQLLSAVEKFDVAHADDAIKALIAAPGLLPLNGIGTDTRMWDRKIATAKKEDIATINGEFKEARQKTEAVNDPMIAYRNAVAARIQVDETTKPKLLQARTEELSQRAAAGYDTRKLWQTLTVEIKTWSALGSKKQITDMIAMLKEYQKRTGPKVYDELVWSKRGATGKPDWKDHDAVLDDKRMQTLLDDLATAQRNAL